MSLWWFRTPRRMSCTCERLFIMAVEAWSPAGTAHELAHAGLLVDLQDLAPGLYHLRIALADGQVQVARVVRAKRRVMDHHGEPPPPVVQQDAHWIGAGEAVERRCVRWRQEAACPPAHGPNVQHARKSAASSNRMVMPSDARAGLARSSRIHGQLGNGHGAGDGGVDVHHYAEGRPQPPSSSCARIQSTWVPAITGRDPPPRNTSPPHRRSCHRPPAWACQRLRRGPSRPSIRRRSWMGKVMLPEALLRPRGTRDPSCRSRPARAQAQGGCPVRAGWSLQPDRFQRGVVVTVEGQHGAPLPSPGRCPRSARPWDTWMSGSSRLPCSTSITVLEGGSPPTVVILHAQVQHMCAGSGQGAGLREHLCSSARLNVPSTATSGLPLPLPESVSQKYSPCWMPVCAVASHRRSGRRRGGRSGCSSRRPSAVVAQALHTQGRPAAHVEGCPVSTTRAAPGVHRVEVVQRSCRHRHRHHPWSVQVVETPRPGCRHRCRRQGVELPSAFSVMDWLDGCCWRRR